MSLPDGFKLSISAPRTSPRQRDLLTVGFPESLTDAEAVKKARSAYNREKTLA